VAGDPVRLQDINDKVWAVGRKYLFLALVVALTLSVGTCRVTACKLRRAEVAAVDARVVADGLDKMEPKRKPAPLSGKWKNVPDLGPLPYSYSRVATLEGEVAYEPKVAAAVDPPAAVPPSGAPPTAAAAPIKEGLADPVNFGITPGDLAGGCGAEIIEEGDRWYARQVWRGKVRLPDGSEVTRTATLEPHLLQVRSTLLDRPQRFVLGVRRPRHWRTGWVAGAGLAYGLDETVRPVAFAGYAVQF
jgi:hypothetical protein